jgi:hypothetical protein
MLAPGHLGPGPSGEDATDVRGDDQGDRDPVERAERFTEDGGADGGGEHRVDAHEDPEEVRGHAAQREDIGDERDDRREHTRGGAARTAGALCVYLEPIALYHTRDLHDDGDQQWLPPYPDPTNWSEHLVPIGRARTYGEGTELTIVTYGNGLHMSLRVARRLDHAHISTRIVDMRWLAPLPIQDIVREANATGRVLVVDETRSSGGVAEGVVTALVDEGFTGPLARVASEHSFIPLGDAALGSAAVRRHHRGRRDQTHPGEPMRYTVRFGDLAVPHPWAQEWNWQMNAAPQAGSATRFAAPVNTTTNPFENAMIFAVTIGGMP